MIWLSPVASATLLAAVRTDDLRPAASPEVSGVLAVVLVAALAAAALCVALAAVLSRPRRRAPKPAARGAHATGGDKDLWRRRVDDVLARHRAGALERQEAFNELAAIARDFASQASGRDLTSSTLADIAGAPHTSADRQGLDLLRVTVTALYPPEFADQTADARAGAVTVEEAAGWVSSLIERWRR